MDKSRKQFEEAIKNGFNTKHLSLEPQREGGCGYYRWGETQRCWEAWQASRESLINSLQPVAWMHPVFHDDKMQFTTDAVTSENIDIHFQSHGSPFKVIPLYRLD